MFDLESRPLNPDAFGRERFTFLDTDYQNDLMNVIAINLVENGDRVARERWQNRQLTGLFKHAHARSRFWRQRMPSRTVSHSLLNFLPVLTRADIVRQVTEEGSLLPNEIGRQVASYSSSGSSGTPVQVFICSENAYYNEIRSLSQYFINNLSLDERRTRINQVKSGTAFQRPAKASTEGPWAGSLTSLFRNGTARDIRYRHDDAAFLRELKQAPLGYLNCQSRHMEIMLREGGVEFIRSLGIRLWLHMSDYRDPDVVARLAAIGIPSLSNYSAAEIGPIAHECRTTPGYFHVAHTNVLVEADETLSVNFEGKTLQRLLITHLHSYATPVIRYDPGDFGLVHTRCPCGHDGPSLSHIYGRGKHFLRHPHGHLVPFYLSTRLLNLTVACKEFRFRQPEASRITVEIGGRDALSAEEEMALREVVAKATDPVFRLEILPVAEIDWGDSPKRLLFSSAVA